MAIAVNKKRTTRENGPERAPSKEATEKKRSTTIATAEMCDSANTLRREGFTFRLPRRHYRSTPLLNQTELSCRSVASRLRVWSFYIRTGLPMFG